MKTKQTFTNSLHNAWTGIIETIKTERNFKIHLFVASTVLFLSLYLKLNSIEFTVILITIGLVLSLEMLNTSIETLADQVDANYNESIKKVKDASAGAVLVFSISAVIAGLLIFIPKLFILNPF